MSDQGSYLNFGKFTAGDDFTTPYVFSLILKGKAILPDAGRYADGVTQDVYSEGQPVNMACLGISKVTCGDMINQGEFVSTNEKGQAVPAKAGTYILGKALEIGVPNQVIQICLLSYNFAKEA